MAIEYRTAVISDNEWLRALDLVSSEGQLAEYGKNKEGLFDVGDYLRRDGSFWVAEDGDKTVGMVGVRMSDEGKMKVKALRVHPNYRNRGIGRVLMILAENFCRGRGEKEIILAVNCESSSAIALYKSLDYIQHDERTFGQNNIVYYFRKFLE